MRFMNCLAKSLEYVIRALHWRPTDPETSEASFKYVDIMLVYLCSWVDLLGEVPLLSLLSLKGFQTLEEATKHLERVAGYHCTWCLW